MPGLRLKELRQKFETALQDGQNPRIEDYLGDAREPERSVLLRELLDQELMERSRKGEVPKPEDYWVRFPEHVRLIGSFFPNLTQSPMHRDMTARKNENPKTPSAPNKQTSRQEDRETRRQGDKEREKGGRSLSPCLPVSLSPCLDSASATPEESPRREHLSASPSRPATAARARPTWRRRFINGVLTVATFGVLAGATIATYCAIQAISRMRAAQAEARRAEEQLTEAQAQTRQAEEKANEAQAKARHAEEQAVLRRPRLGKQRQRTPSWPRACAGPSRNRPKPRPRSG